MGNFSGVKRSLLRQSSVPAFLPSDLANLSLWLKSDSGTHVSGSNITSWDDQSAGGYSALGAGSARPLLVSSVLNGKPAIRFDGTDDSLSIANFALTTNFTIFVVGRFTEAKSMFIEQSVDSSFNPGFFFFGAPGADVILQTFRTDSQYVDSAESYWMGASSTYVTGRQSGGVYTVRKAGANISLNAPTGLNQANTTATDTLWIGSRAGINLFSEGDLFELITYSAALTDGQINQVESYLARRYGL